MHQVFEKTFSYVRSYQITIAYANNYLVLANVSFACIKCTKHVTFIMYIQNIWVNSSTKVCNIILPLQLFDAALYVYR